MPRRLGIPPHQELGVLCWDITVRGFRSAEYPRIHSSAPETPHGELIIIMAPRAGFDTEQVRDRARKDLLHLLEGVSRWIPFGRTPVHAEVD